MEIQWLGTAGFRIKFQDQVILVDPYLSRNPDARPIQPLCPKDMAASHIFISHGHFDHLMDVPAIASRTNAMVYCSREAAVSLKKTGLNKDQILEISRDNWEGRFDSFHARAFFSHHVKFDKKLLFSTLWKINFKIPKYLPLFREFPCGQVLSWQFSLGGKRLHFFGSAGSPLDELERLKRGSDPIDILLVPLQGHSDICEIAARYVKIFNPKLVIPHHQDDFFPPISRQVDITPFVKQIKKESPATRVKILKFNESFYIE
jgi:L-ascorbate metabolism protein UlaG (beta-lactamase superfamily)